MAVMGMDRELERKNAALLERIEGCAADGMAVAFSGGVDSALLLKVACLAAQGRGAVHAVTVRTKLHPAGELETAGRAAGECGARHHVLDLDELAECGIETNPVNRCYLCKRSIFRKIKGLAEELGAAYVLDGTNADDLLEYRPGIRALKELQIISPLADCGLTKAEIRELAAHYGIQAANRPSAPCLATRLPYGTKISYDLLRRIDEGERFLRELGFYNVRLRAHELTEMVKEGEPEKRWLARIEVDAEDIPRLFEHREALTELAKGLGFARVTADLEGFRSGSMDSGKLSLKLHGNLPHKLPG